MMNRDKIVEIISDAICDSHGYCDAIGMANCIFDRLDKAGLLLKEQQPNSDNHPQLQQTDVSRSLLSEWNLERCANLYAEQENSAYTNDYYGYYNGAKQMGNAVIEEIRRRQQMIITEPDGIVRETMINDLLVGLQ